MPLVYVFFVLIAVGMALWLVNTYIPMARGVKAILNAVAVLTLCVWLLKVFGLWTQIVNYRVTF
jgi:hypothetical protein